MALDFNLENLTPEEIQKLSPDQIDQLNLHSIAENTRKTIEGNQSQTIANRDDARDRTVSAQIGLKKAYGEAVFTGIDLVSGFAGNKGNALKPLTDKLRTVFNVYMGIQDQRRSLEVAEKQVGVASEKLLDMGINPETKKPLDAEERAAHAARTAAPASPAGGPS